MAVTSKKPILVDQPILEGLQRLRDDECRRYNSPVTFGGYRLSVVETPDDEIGQIIAGGAFGLSAYDVVYECRDYTLTLMSDETEETAMRRVIPSLLYALADDTD